MIETLDRNFGKLKGSDSLESAILSAAESAVKENYEDYTNDLMTLINDSYLEDTSEDYVRSTYRQLMVNSLAYMIMERCDVDTGECFEREDFMGIINFNTPETLNALGIAVNDTTQIVMAEIAKTVIKLNRQNNINLEKIIDANENEITVSYSGGNISKVTDGVGREITFTTGNGYLQKITDPAGRETTFTYNNGKLSEITHPDGNKSFYSYDGDSSLSSVYDHTGYGYAFGYNSKTQGNASHQYRKKPMYMALHRTARK